MASFSVAPGTWPKREDGTTYEWLLAGRSLDKRRSFAWSVGTNPCRLF